MHSRPRLATGLFVAVLLVTGCTSEGDDDATVPTPTAPDGASEPSPSATDQRSGGSFRFALSTDPQSIDPRFVADGEGGVVVDALFDSLVAFGPGLGIVPAAASEWEISEDGRIFTFTLREGATFHDGSPVTAEDFVRTFSRIADGQAQPPSFHSFQLEPVTGFAETHATGVPLAGVEALDATTLRISLDEPFPEFLEVLARPSLAPVPASSEDAPDAFGESPVGNGPFVLAEPWQRNQFIRVERFDGYAGTPPHLDEVVFRIYANDAAQETQYAEFANGQLQFAEVPASKRREAVEQFGLSTDGYTGPGVLDGLSSTIYYYGFNLERPPFDAPELRRAISLSIDRDRIAEEITRDTRVPATGIVPPSIPGAQASACDHCRYDPAEAAALVDGLRETGTEFQPITILHDTGSTHAAIAERIAEDVEAATGLQVRTRAEELRPYVQLLREGEMEVFRLGWQADYPSPGSYLFPLFSTEHLAVDNLTRYQDEEVDELLSEARATADDAERRRVYRSVEERILADVAIAPILFYRHNKVVAPEVRDFTYGPMGTVDLARVWLTN